MIRLFFFQQFLDEHIRREQELRARDRDQRVEKPLPPPLVSPRISNHEDQAPRPPKLHRPFETPPLTNGFEKNHYSDYERRLLNERILAQDRLTFAQERSPAGPNRTEQRNHEPHLYDRGRLVEKHTPDKHEGLQARVLESENSHSSHLYNRPAPHPYNYERPALDYSHHRVNSFPPPPPDSKEGIVVNPNFHHPKELRIPEPNHFKPYESQLRPNVLSRLDYEEKLVRKARQNGEYDSEAESEDELEKEENRKHMLMVIKEGPPLDMDRSPMKLKFLAGVGVTTLDRKTGKLTLT